MVTLTTGAKVVVMESADEVAAAVREWRVLILTDALKSPRPGRRAA